MYFTVITTGYAVRLCRYSIHVSRSSVF